jgi:hypothetical protein
MMRGVGWVEGTGGLGGSARLSEPRGQRRSQRLVEEVSMAKKRASKSKAKKKAPAKKGGAKKKK